MSAKRFADSIETTSLALSDYNVAQKAEHYAPLTQGLTEPLDREKEGLNECIRSADFADVIKKPCPKKGFRSSEASSSFEVDEFLPLCPANRALVRQDAVGDVSADRAHVIGGHTI